MTSINKPIPNPLSSRQQTVLSMISRGSSYKVVARELKISINTVKMHINEIKRKLDASTVYNAVSIAVQHNYIPLDLED